MRGEDRPVIGIVALPEYGHLTPVLRLCAALQARGCDVVAFAPPAFRSLFEAHGARVEPSFDVCTDEFLRRRLSATEDEHRGMLGSLWQGIHETVQRGVLQDALLRVRPRVVLADACLGFMGLLALELGIPFAQYGTQLPTDIPEEIVGEFKIRMREWAPSMLALDEELVARHPHVATVGFPELGAVGRARRDAPTFVMCPEPFGSPRALDRYPNARWIESLPIGEPPLPRAQREGQVVYVSLGSTRTLWGRSSEVYATLAEAMARLKNVRFLVSADKRAIDLHAARLPNAEFREFWPQREILRTRVHAAVIHAGLGGMKECAWSGVPMVALPFFGDQIANGQRIRDLGCGVLPSIPPSVDELVDAIERVLRDDQIHARTESLARAVREFEAGARGVTGVLGLVG